MINTVISALMQVCIFTLIPLVVYLIKRKQFKGFFEYIGLKKSTRKANFLALLLMVLLASPILFLVLIDDNFKEILTNPESVSGSIRQMGFGAGAVATILVVAIIKTGLAEEILFRGFIAKRLIAVTNYKTGNWIQAILFGLIHTLLFYKITSNPLFLAIIFIIPTIGAYLKVHLNEKLANGSIIPGWIAHATANVISYSLIAFFL